MSEAKCLEQPLPGAQPRQDLADFAASSEGQSELPSRLTLLLALTTGLSAATLYYAQPILGVLAQDIGASERAIGMIPTATQLSYALGILLFGPLGDRFDRRGIILFKAAALTLALLAAACAPSVGWLIGASFGIGITASLAQDIVPAAASLASERHRGRVVGSVMTGLLLGILMSRVLSGLVAQQYGWRAVFFVAAASIAASGLALRQWLPRFEPTTSLPYRTLLVSLGELWRKYPTLRSAAIAQGLLASAFSAFWSTLAVMLHAAPFHLGSAAAGAFGLAGAAGALIAPVAGRIADTRGPSSVTRIGISATVLAFVAMAAATLLSPHAQLWALGITTLIFDLGVQATLISHQSIVYSLEPGARSRLNTVFVVVLFLGMAMGAAVGTLLFAQWGWIAVIGYAVVASLLALAMRIRSSGR